MGYFLAFLVALVVDSIPVFAPPAWTVLLFLVIHFRLEPWPAIALGALGSTLGRYCLTCYVPWLSRKIINKREDSNITFIGGKLKAGKMKGAAFVLAYSLTPLSTTALFTAAGMSRVPAYYTLPAFFIGKFMSDAVMILTGKKSADGLKQILTGQASPKSMIFLGLGVLLLGALFFVDWKALLTKKRLRFRFDVLKTS